MGVEGASHPVQEKTLTQARAKELSGERDGGAVRAREDVEAAVGHGVEAPVLPAQASGRHWRKIRSAVTALAAFRSHRVKAADFERIRMCGEGGSGLVYLVRLKNTTMFFALKVQRKTDLEAKDKRIRRALIEKEVLVACAHPFVCNLYTAFQDSRHLYLLMDFCAGGDLRALVRDVAKRALTEGEARFYVSEIVAALEWVHLHGYIYRDLKPENVLIHSSGHIRLGDFGTAERGRLRCPGEKLCPQEVEKALVESSMASPWRNAGGGAGDEMPMIPALEGSGGNDGYTHSGDDEGDLDDYDDGVDEGVSTTSIIVQVDPLLAESSSKRVDGTASESSSAAGASGTDPAATAPATGAHGGEREVCPDDGRDDDVVEPVPGVYSPVGCGCSKRRRTAKSADGPRAPAMPAQPFAKGRGSVKLNVLLDSQTFIGTADFMAPEMVTGTSAQGTGMDWWALGVMLFEITLGTLPFHSELPCQSSNEVFRSIVNAELKFPRRHNLSRSAVDFIRQLLRKDPTERLGQRKGVGEIKRHPFFRTVHWALIANSTPPFVLSGPETPGWLASMQSAPDPGARDEKMATWTWMATEQDGPRPGMENKDMTAALSKARDNLDSDSPSGRHSKADLSKLADELRISEEPAGADVAAAAAAGEAGHGTTTMISEGGDDFDDGMPNSGPVTGSRVPKSAAMAAAPTSADEGEGAGGAAAGRGEKSAAIAENRRRVGDSRNSFDGYDFNTLRKLGSVPIGGSVS